MKNKLYQTITGSIILFIKLQLLDQIQQVFRPLYILTSNLNLNLSFNPNGLIIYIIPNIFVSSSIRLIFNSRSCLQQQKSLCIQSSQAQAHIFIMSGGYWIIYQKVFVILANTLTDKADIHIRENPQLHLAKLSSTLLPRDT